MSSNKKIPHPVLPYWKVFRLFFVLFSLYLLRDVFYRWDGFRYHSTIFEFMPSVALVTVLWSIVAAVAALLAWLLLRVFDRFCLRLGWKINSELLMVFTGYFVLLAAAVWTGKNILLHEQLSTILKSILFIVITTIAVYLTWRFRNKSDLIHERITPIVWLFGIWFIVAIPIVFYHTWIKHDSTPTMHKVNETVVSRETRPNIILVVFDALTARNMQVYGYPRHTTPFINEWSKTATLFNRVESSSNWTPPSMASIMTGKRGWTHKTFQDLSIPLKSNIENFPLVLKNHGYYNIAFVVNSFASVKKLNIAESFDMAPHFLEFVKSQNLIGWKFGILDTFLNRTFRGKIKFYTWIITPDFILGKLIRAIYFRFISISQTEVPPEIAFDKFIETLDNGVQEPYFAWIHLFPPHDPYMPPAPYSGMFDNSTKLRTYNQQRGDLTNEKISKEENWSIFKARYDEYIRYCDKTFEEFIANLTRMDKLQNTVVILTSDHGESFDHGDFTHGHSNLYEQLTHVPLIIKEPGQTKGRIINDLSEQIDITPTILSMANIQAPTWMEGRSLMPFLRGEQLPPKPVFSMTFKKNPGRMHEITKGTIAVWEGDYKLSHYLESGKSLLFNLQEDPDEQMDLFDTNQETGMHLLELIKDNLKKANDN